MYEFPKAKTLVPFFPGHSEGPLNSKLLNSVACFIKQQSACKDGAVATKDFLCLRLHTQCAEHACHHLLMTISITLRGCQGQGQGLGKPHVLLYPCPSPLTSHLSPPTPRSAPSSPARSWSNSMCPPRRQLRVQVPSFPDTQW